MQKQYRQFQREDGGGGAECCKDKLSGAAMEGIGLQGPLQINSLSLGKLETKGLWDV